MCTYKGVSSTCKEEGKPLPLPGLTQFRDLPSSARNSPPVPPASPVLPQRLLHSLPGSSSHV